MIQQLAEMDHERKTMQEAIEARNDCFFLRNTFFSRAARRNIALPTPCLESFDLQNCNGIHYFVFKVIYQLQYANIPNHLIL